MSYWKQWDKSDLDDWQGMSTYQDDDHDDSHHRYDDTHDEDVFCSQENDSSLV